MTDVVSEQLLADLSVGGHPATAPDRSPEALVRDARVCQGRQGACFFQGAQKFKTRYAALGFNEAATLDDGKMWPTAYALTEMTPAVEDRIGALVTRVVQ